MFVILVAGLVVLGWFDLLFDVLCAVALLLFFMVSILCGVSVSVEYFNDVGGYFYSH
jgi:hypothetical protein